MLALRALPSRRNAKRLLLWRTVELDIPVWTSSDRAAAGGTADDALRAVLGKVARLSTAT